MTTHSNSSLRPDSSLLIKRRINLMPQVSLPFRKLRVLNGMANRTQFNSHMEHGIEDLKQYYTEFEDEFREFFPDLESFVKGEIEGLE